MFKIGIGSNNPSKIEAARLAYKKMEMEADIIGIEVDSNVSEQPFSDEETMEGAVNRAENVMTQMSDLDYAIGLEGGVVETPYGMFLCNWAAIIDKDGNLGIGGGQRVQLPEQIVESLKMGRELGEVIDLVTGKLDVKKNDGTIGILTNNYVTRSSMFSDAIICAYSRFLHPKLYQE